MPSMVVLAKFVNNPPLLKTSKNPSGRDSFKLWTGFVYSYLENKELVSAAVGRSPRKKPWSVTA